MRLVLPTLLVLIVGWLEAAAQEQDFAAELPHLAPLEPQDALKSFQLKPGVRLEQVAAEPLVASPVALAWDEDSRLYVCEMRGYSENRDEALSRVRLLEDLNSDGRYDRSTVFAEGLLWPTAVACWDGGVFVGDAPHIYYLKDTDGDGRADRREIVFTGFNTTNVQGLLNSFTWTLDNRIEGSASSTGGEITRPDAPHRKPVSVRGRDFAFDPRTRELIATSGGAQHGLTFDDCGRKFVCSNSDHIQQVMFEDRYIARNPYLTVPSARVSIAADGPQAEVFRTSPVEPWRIVRTRLRVSGAVPGVVEGGGRASGYFTSATGLTIYRGDLLPAEFKGLAIVGDVGSNLVHRKRISGDGLQLVAARIDEKSELLTSTDNWFRPVQFANGPDGALYIIDMYREVIEHPASIPPAIKKHLDLTSGRDRGRLYRMVPTDFRAVPLPRLGRLSTLELVALLDHPNAWHRATASRLLYERQDKSAIPSLSKLALEGKSPVGRWHAIQALSDLGGLTAEHVVALLGDEAAEVRAWTLRLKWPAADVRSASLLAMQNRAAQLAQDPDIRVRYQLAFTAGQFEPDLRRAVLLRLAESDGNDPWMRVAIQSSCADDAGALSAELLASSPARQDPGVRRLLAALATQVSRRNDSAEVAVVVKQLEGLADGDATLALMLVRALVDGRGAHAREQLAQNGLGTRLLGPLVRRAQATASDEHQAIARRVDAIGTLALASFDEVRPTLAALIDNRQPQEVQQAAVTTLSQSNDRRVVDILVDAWPTLSPRLRTSTTDAIFARGERVRGLLDAIEAGRFQPGELEPARVQQLLASQDADLQARAKRLLAGVKLARRQDVVDAYRPVLALKGDVARGKLVFGKVCAACHRAEGVGYEIGPSLSAIKNRGPEAILLNVLDPSREVNPQFVNYLCITDDGRSFSGLLASETATSITLRRAENQQDTVLRINIEQLRSTGLSLMPEGLEKLIDLPGMADVIAYVMQLP
jgi:putative membrane-bound dehydrogenase-like protein